MKKKIVIGILSIIGGVFLSVNSFGQAEPGFQETFLEINPRLFIAILGGLLLALGFQLVLVNLSAAAGISAIGNIREKANKSSGDTHKGEHDPKNKDKNKDKESGTPAGVKFMSAAGAWAMISCAIALFFASFFAVRLSLLPSDAIGVSLGLVIWAAFFLTMFYLESKALTWAVGSVFSTAFNAIKSGFSGLKNMVSPSETSKAEHVAERSIEKVTEEVSHMFAGTDTKEIATKIEDYVNKLQPKKPDYGLIKSELADLLNEIKIEERPGEHLGDKEIFLQVAEKQPNVSKEDLSKLGNLYDEVKSKGQEVKSAEGDTMVDKVVNTIPGAPEIKDQIETYLRQSEESELDPDLLKAELEEIFKHPGNATQIISSKAGSFNKESVLSVVCAQEGVDCNKARKMADKVEEAINKIKSQVAGNQEKVANKSKELQSQANQQSEGAGEQFNQKKDELLAKFENRVRNFFERTERPELQYEPLKWDFEKMLHDPKVAPEVLKERLSKMDSESLVGLLAANKNISRAEAENIVGKYEEAKANVMVKVDQIQNEVKRRVEETKQMALQQAEDTRKTAAAASWWVLGTMLVGLAASVVGGALAF